MLIKWLRIRSIGNCRVKDRAYNEVQLESEEFLIRARDMEDVRSGKRERPRRVYRVIGRGREDYKVIATRNRKVLERIVLYLNKNSQDFS